MKDGSDFAGRVTIPLDGEDWALLSRLANEEKLPKSEIIRRALRLYRPTVRMPEFETKNAVNG